MADFLFSCSEDPNRLRLFRQGEEWHECFVVEFMLGANHYEHLYWGNLVDDKEARMIISSMLIMKDLPNSHDKWRRIKNKNHLSKINASPILQLAEDEIKRRTRDHMEHAKIEE